MMTAKATIIMAMKRIIKYNMFVICVPTLQPVTKSALVKKYNKMQTNENQ